MGTCFISWSSGEGVPVWRLTPRQIERDRRQDITNSHRKPTSQGIPDCHLMAALSFTSWGIGPRRGEILSHGPVGTPASGQYVLQPSMLSGLLIG